MPSWRQAICFTPIGKLNCSLSNRPTEELKIALPGDNLFISYKTSLYEYCQNNSWPPPVYVTRQRGSRWTSKASFGGNVYFSKTFKRLHEFDSPKQIIEQKAAYMSLVGIGVISAKTKFNINGINANLVACISVPCPGDTSFVSYKCSLHDFCQQYNILAPKYTTWKNHTGYSSMVQVGHIVSHTFNMAGKVDNSQEVEQKAAFVALQELCMINSQASYRPDHCFTVPGPDNGNFISFKSSLHDFCHRFNVPPPQYITQRFPRGYTTKLKFGGLFFQTSQYFKTRLIAEQHAAFEALHGLGQLESVTIFMESDCNRSVAGSPPFQSYRRSELSLSSVESLEIPQLLTSPGRGHAHEILARGSILGYA